MKKNQLSHQEHPVRQERLKRQEFEEFISILLMDLVTFVVKRFERF
jgi:hypothetical protein